MTYQTKKNHEVYNLLLLSDHSIMVTFVHIWTLSELTDLVLFCFVWFGFSIILAQWHRHARVLTMQIQHIRLFTTKVNSGSETISSVVKFKSSKWAQCIFQSYSAKHLHFLTNCFLDIIHFCQIIIQGSDGAKHSHTLQFSSSSISMYGYIHIYILQPDKSKHYSPVPGWNSGNCHFAIPGFSQNHHSPPYCSSLSSVVRRNLAPQPPGIE